MSRWEKYIYKPIEKKPGDKPWSPSYQAVLVEQSRFNVDELVRLRAERGIGPIARIAAAVRATFVMTKRNA